MKANTLAWLSASLLLSLLAYASGAAAAQPSATLVESMPQHMDDLNASVSLHTATALIDLLDGAEHTLDVAVMYWSLLTASCGANATNITGNDCAGFSPAQLAAMGAGTGVQAHDALVAAAKRGVRIRILQSAGFSSEAQGGTFNAESAALASRFPQTVTVRTLNLSAWYGSGIQHSKFIIADSDEFLIGSSNFMDWRSLVQVKELSLLVQHAPTLAADLGLFFDDAWAVASLDARAPTLVASYSDPGALRDRPVPCWSPLLPPSSRCPSPLPAGPPPASRSEPLDGQLNGHAARTFFSCAPAAFCRASRTPDEDTLVGTILSAKSRVSVAVMDFVPGSQSLWSTGPPVYWPALTDALLRVSASRKVDARLLVSEWQWTDPSMAPYLHALLATSRACTNRRGSLKVRSFTVPGWNDTVGAGRRWPGHTRVNHNKYIVSEDVANVATSNMAWSYFATTLGASVNIQQPQLAAGLQNVFDRDWESQYAADV